MPTDDRRPPLLLVAAFACACASTSQNYNAELDAEAQDIEHERDIAHQMNNWARSHPERHYRWTSPVPSPCPPRPEVYGQVASGCASAAGGTCGKAATSKPLAGAVSNAAQVIKSMRPGFRACYQGFIDRVPLPVKANLRLSMYVDCTGKVVEIQAVASMLDQEALTCVFKIAASGHFDPPEGGSSVVHVPVTYVPE